CVIGNCECITAVRRERHLCLLWFSPVGEYLVKDGSDMRRRVVGRQVELDRDPFPKTVGMFENAISRNIAGEDWHGIQAYVREVFTEPAFQAWRQSLHEGRLQLFGAKNATGHVPDRAFVRRQVAYVFREKINLRASRFS